MEENNNTKAYLEALTEAIQLSRKFHDIDPQLAAMYLDTVQVFGEAVQAVYKDHMDLSSNDAKLKVFEKMFDINIESELSDMVTNIVTNGISDEDINNKSQVDDDLLANIKNNIQNYLKD